MTEVETDKIAITPRMIMMFFGHAKLAEFSQDWKSLTDADKGEVREGIRSGIASGDVNADGMLKLVAEGKLRLESLV